MLFQSDGMPSLGALGIDPTRSGNEFGFAVPANVYDCKDGSIFCGVLFDLYGNYELAFTTMAFISLTGSICFYLARPPKHTPLPAEDEGRVAKTEP